MKIAVVKNLQSLSNFLVMLGVGVMFFDLQYYLMKNLPGTDGYQCLPGANLTVANLIFAVLISLMFGIMIAGLITVYKQRRAAGVGSTVLSSVGMFFGTMTAFCTVCSLPVISLFGLSIGLTFFTTYVLWFKVLSVALMLVGLYFLNKQLEGECKVCK